MIIRDTKYLTVKEAAALIGVSDKTVFNWIYNDRLSCIHLGAKVLIAEAEVERFIDAAVNGTK